MNTHDESSDSLEEGELSEAQSLASPSSSIGMNMSGDEGRWTRPDDGTTRAIMPPVVLSSTHTYAILTVCL